MRKRWRRKSEYEQAHAEGFTLIQGYYFCRPVLLKNRKVPANRLSQMEILRALAEDAIDLRKMSRLVKRDTSLTYRLLRLINSPLCAVRQEVSSVQGALIAVGRRCIPPHRHAGYYQRTQCGPARGGAADGLYAGAVLRAGREMCGLNPTEQYLLGLLSLLPAMLRLPMEELAPIASAARSDCQALKGADLPEGMLLAWLENHEHGDWAACDEIIQTLDLEQEELQDAYDDAVVWAESALHFS